MVAGSGIALDYVVRGNAKAAQTIFFMHGWPDTDALYDHQYPIFEKDYRLVTLLLPTYADQTEAMPYCGLPLPEVIDRAENAVKKAMKGRPAGDKPALVCHDWGSVVAYAVVDANPDFFSRLVALDIGQHSGKQSFKGMAIILWYQFTLMFAYFMPSFLGNAVTRMMAKVFKAPNPSAVHQSMNFMYVQTWKLVLTSSLPKTMTSWRPPKIPVLYMYGTKKPFFFHSKRWIEHLQAAPGSSVAPFDADHWFFVRRRCREEVNSKMLRFIKADEK